MNLKLTCEGHTIPSDMQNYEQILDAHTVHDSRTLAQNSSTLPLVSGDHQYVLEDFQ